MRKLQRKSHLSRKPNRSGEPLKIAFTQNSNKLTWKNQKLGLSSAPDSPKAAGDVPQQPASMWLGSGFRRREERRDGWDLASIAQEGSLQQATSGRIPASRGETNGGTREREKALPKPDGILINTYEALEPRALLRAILDGSCVPDAPTPPVYCVGPLIAMEIGDGGRE
ncbi:hypothetical protein MRB53_030097 [Persea americana]|uniref:Uncharacterized protein n=1 Tax=Persea americana TaxID=3435 RepID=A0ACC2KKW1_PERAE|nr:hypothetical protein MRB53_030097 [Persea americana]